jgi:hypothetical protein
MSRLLDDHSFCELPFLRQGGILLSCWSRNFRRPGLSSEDISYSTGIVKL